MSCIRLSICIATRNRAQALAETLDLIIQQCDHECEIVIVDGASTDSTEQVVAERTRRFAHVTYLRRDAPYGYDTDFDVAVQAAHGDYCWLMPDDDVLKPNAIATVLEGVRSGYALILANFEIVDMDSGRMVVPSVSELREDRVFVQGDLNELFLEAGLLATYLGSVIIKRSVWLERERERYYGSLHAHIGIIFQEQLPGDALLVARPLVQHRVGQNHSWRSRASDMIFKWPEVVGSLAVSNDAKRKCMRWMVPIDFGTSLILRGMDYISARQLRRWTYFEDGFSRKTRAAWIASWIPGILANACCVLYYSMRPKGFGKLIVVRLQKSPLYVGSWYRSMRFAQRNRTAKV